MKQPQLTLVLKEGSGVLMEAALPVFLFAMGNPIVQMDWMKLMAVVSALTALISFLKISLY